MLSFTCTATITNDKHACSCKDSKPFKCYVEYFPAAKALSIFNVKNDGGVPPRFVREENSATGEVNVIDASAGVRKARKSALVTQIHVNQVINVLPKSGVMHGETTPPAVTECMLVYRPIKSTSGRISVIVFTAPRPAPPCEDSVASPVLAMVLPGQAPPASSSTGNDNKQRKAPPDAAYQLYKLQDHLFGAAFPYGPQHFTALISPVSGKGEGPEIWEQVAVPLLRASPHKYSVILTTHRGHAEEYAERALLQPNEVLVAVGGDGMAHEVVNGLNKRAESEPPLMDAIAARRPRVALFPTGSGCALAKTLEVIEPIDAAMALLHSESTPLDLMDLGFEPVTRLAAGKHKKDPRVEMPAEEITVPRRVAFLSVNLAFGAAVDIESEVYRWMGNARFTFYAVKKILPSVPSYPVTVRYLPATVADLHRAGHGVADAQAAPHNTPLDTVARVTSGCQPFSLANDLRAAERQRNDAASASPPPRVDVRPARDGDAADAGETVAVPVSQQQGEDGWVTLEQSDFVFIILCNIPWIARDMFAAPYGHVNDMCMDLIFAGPGVGRSNLVKALIDMEEGKHITNPKMRYVKCRACEIIPRDGLISIDGEKFPLAKVTAKIADNRVSIISAAAKPHPTELEQAVLEAATRSPL
jgi:sphingosine kinase